MNRTQDTIILEKIFNERLELSIYKNRGQFYLTKNLRKQFRHKIEINIDVKNQKRLIIKELDEGNVQQNFYSKKLAQHISDLVGVNAIIVFAVGYCMVYSFQKDLIEKNRRNKRKEPKKNLSRKHKYRWKNKDYQLIGWLLIIVAIVFYGAYVNWQGIQNAQKQELFLTTRIDNDTYIVVMTDGDEAILEKDRTGKDGKLKICKDKYMKVDCKNRLLEKKKYRRASGDGE